MIGRGNLVTILSVIWSVSVACQDPDHGSRRSREDLIGDPQATDCVAPQIGACEEILGRLSELNKSLDDAIADSDANAVARLTLELNYERERYDLHSRNQASDEAVRALDTKYQVLRDLLAREISSGPGSTTGGDGRSRAYSSLVYHRLEIEAVKRVFQDFGDLHVADTGRNEAGEPIYIESEAPMPWAGYWYPLAGTELFEGSDSPLAKLDRLTSRLGRPTTAAAQESELRDFAAEDSWEGRCFAWATAAVTSSEPTSPVEIEGVTFTIEDRKALLVKAHETYPTRHYGIRYNGDAVTDGTLQDIRPEAFHRIFMSVLVEQQRPFIIDDDAGIEVWSKPVYRMRWTIQPDPEIANAFIVDALPFMVGHRTAESADPTTARDRTAPAYRYRLYVDPSALEDGRQRVIAGEWIDQSRSNHPDSVAIAEPEGPLGSSNNSEMNGVLDIVRQVLEATP